MRVRPELASYDVRMIRYRERGLGARTQTVLLVVLAAVWVWLAVAAHWLVATAVVAFVGLLTLSVMWSTVRERRIRLTDTELRAGGRRIRLADIQRSGVSQPGDEIRPLYAGDGLLVETGSNTVDTSKALELRLRGGPRVLVWPRDPDALRAALEEALKSFRVDA